MKRVNYPLIIGTIILLVLLIVSIYSETFVSIDPFSKQRVETMIVNGETKIVIPPIRPCNEHPLGTDFIGRDLRSLIIMGCRQTMVFALIVALIRIIIAIPIAMLAAYKVRMARFIIKLFNIIFGAFPFTLLVILFLRIKLYNNMFDSWLQAAGFLLVAFGWSRVANIIMKKVEELLEQDFIQGEIAIGKSRLQITLQNILPHVIPSLVVVFFLEVAIVLLLMVPIGTLGAVVNKTFFDLDGGVRIPPEYDWISLLRFSNYLIGGGKEWVIIFPTAALAIAIIGFNLFGEGLRLELEKKSSRIISMIRRLPSFLSPLRFAYEIKNFKEHSRVVCSKALLCIIITLVIFFPQPKSEYSFDIKNMKNTLIEMKNRNDISTKFILDKLTEYNIVEYGTQYIHYYEPTIKINAIKSTAMRAYNNSQSKIEFEYKKDYLIEFYNFVDDTYAFEVINKELTNLDKDKIWIIDMRNITQDAYEKLAGKINYIMPKGVIKIIDDRAYEDLEKSIQVRKHLQTMDIDFSHILYVSPEKGEELLKLRKGTIELSINPFTSTKEVQANILALIEGKDEKLKDEYIVLGCPMYRFIKADGTFSEDKTTNLAIQLEIARALGQSGYKPKRSIIFAFWGGQNEVERGSEYLGIDAYEKVYYIDISNIASENFEKVFVDISRFSIDDEVAQSFAKALRKNARRNDVELVYGNSSSVFAKDFNWLNTGILVLDKTTKKFNSFVLLKDRDNSKGLKNTGQVLLDTIVDMAERTAK